MTTDRQKNWTKLSKKYRYSIFHRCDSIYRK